MSAEVWACFVCMARYWFFHVAAVATSTYSVRDQRHPGWVVASASTSPTCGRRLPTGSRLCKAWRHMTCQVLSNGCVAYPSRDGHRYEYTRTSAGARDSSNPRLLGRQGHEHPGTPVPSHLTGPSTTLHQPETAATCPRRPLRSKSLGAAKFSPRSLQLRGFRLNIRTIPGQFSDQDFHRFRTRGPAELTQPPTIPSCVMFSTQSGFLTFQVPCAATGKITYARV